MRRKNTKFIDPRYFMDEKIDKAPEPPEEQPECGADETWNKDTQKCVGLNEGLGDEPEPASFADQVTANRKRYVNRMARDYPNIPRIAIEIMSRLVDPHYNPEDVEPEAQPEAQPE